MRTFKPVILALACATVLQYGCKKQSTAETPGEKIGKAEQQQNTTSGGVQIMSVLFNGDASNGSANVWKDINIEGTGTDRKSVV